MGLRSPLGTALLRTYRILGYYTSECVGYYTSECVVLGVGNE